VTKPAFPILRPIGVVAVLLLCTSASGQVSVQREACCQAAQTWLKSIQQPDGNWVWNPDDPSEYPDTKVGVTGMVTLALISEWRRANPDKGLPDVEQPHTIGRAVEWLKRQQQPDGRISTPDAAGSDRHAVYNTACAIFALTATRNRDHADAVSRAAAYLESCQWTANPTGIPLANVWYQGGFGYFRPINSTYRAADRDRPDHSNTQLSLIALRAAELPGWWRPSRCSIWELAKGYVERCQFQTSTNPMAPPLPDDGGFGYWARYGTEFESGYGSMTAAGIINIYLCTLISDPGLDPRIKGALAWFRANYRYDTNPGHGPEYFAYYLWSASRAFGYLNLTQVSEPSLGGTPHRLVTGSDAATEEPGWFYDFSWELTLGPHRPTWAGTACYWDMDGSRTYGTALAMLTLRRITATEFSTQATAVWQHRDPGTGDWDICAADYAPQSGNWWVRTWSMPSGNDHDPAIAFDRGGNALAVWSHGSIYSVYYSRRAATGSVWTTPKPVWIWWTVVHGHDPEFDPAIALDTDSTGLCVWVRKTSTGQGLWYARWDGSRWRAGRMLSSDAWFPEVVFTSVPASPGSATSHKAVAVWVGKPSGSTEPAKVFYGVWDGSDWTVCEGIPGQTLSVPAPAYEYAGTTSPSLPAQPRLGLSADNSGNVLAVWQSETDVLCSSQGTITATGCDWSEPEVYQAYPAPAIAGVPAVAHGLGAPASAVSVFRKHPSVTPPLTMESKTRDHVGAWSGLIPISPSSVPRGQGRPAVAHLWPLAPSPGLAIAVWSQAETGEGEIYFSRFDLTTWSNPVPIVQPDHVFPRFTGDDLNPDIAAPTGSHTRPPLPRPLLIRRSPLEYRPLEPERGP